MNSLKRALTATCVAAYLSLPILPANSQTASTTPSPATAPTPPPPVSFDPPKGILGLKHTTTPNLPGALRASTTQPSPTEVDLKLRQLKPAEIKALDQLLAKKSRTLAEWVGIVGPVFKTNESLLSAIASASVLADLARMPKKDFDKAHTDPAIPIPATPAEIKAQITELKKYPRLIAGLKGVVSNATIQPNKALIDVATSLVAPPLSIPAASIVSDICSDPLIEHRGDSVSKCFALKIRFGYPCWSWSKGWHTCHYTVNFGSLCFTAGCDVGYKISCCEATVWGSCYAQACLSGYCAGCTGAITAGAGVTSTNMSGGMCSYGLNAIASIQCKVGGHTVYHNDVPLSPYSVQGPCPPGGVCP